MDDLDPRRELADLRRFGDEQRLKRRIIARIEHELLEGEPIHWPGLELAKLFVEES